MCNVQLSYGFVHVATVSIVIMHVLTCFQSDESNSTRSHRCWIEGFNATASKTLILLKQLRRVWRPKCPFLSQRERNTSVTFAALELEFELAWNRVSLFSLPFSSPFFFLFFSLFFFFLFLFFRPIAWKKCQPWQRFHAVGASLDVRPSHLT